MSPYWDKGEIMVALKALIKARSLCSKNIQRPVKKYVKKAWLENYGRRYQ